MYKIYLDEKGKIGFYNLLLRCGNETYPAIAESEIERMKRDIISQYEESKLEDTQAQLPVFTVETLQQPTPEQLSIIVTKCGFVSVDEAQKFTDEVMTGAYVPPLTIDDVAIAVAELGVIVGEVMSNG